MALPVESSKNFNAKVRTCNGNWAENVIENARNVAENLPSVPKNAQKVMYNIKKETKKLQRVVKPYAAGSQLLLTETPVFRIN